MSLECSASARALIEYRMPPHALTELVPPLCHCSIDPSYAIEFPPLDSASANPFLIETLRGCLRRDPKRRLTIPELLEHPFIQPDKVIAHLLDRLKANGTTITNQNE